jgi:hypothetical protein
MANSRSTATVIARRSSNICLARGLSVASHDDATLAHVEESARYGMTIAEFPTTVEAARGCRGTACSVLMGAPNIVRGGSHSGNVAAADLAAEGLAGYSVQRLLSGEPAASGVCPGRSRDTQRVGWPRRCAWSAWPGPSRGFD